MKKEIACLLMVMRNKGVKGLQVGLSMPLLKYHPNIGRIQGGKQH